jgi:disulfide bond formation protein DsbB
MTLAETVLPPSRAARALITAAASIAVLAAVWIFQAFGYAPCELCLTQRYAFYAAAPLAALTAFLASRPAHGLARAGFALLAAIFIANAALAAYHVGV